MDEYISREEVMSVIANMQEEHHYDAANLEDRYVVAHLLEVADKIKDLKAADVRPVSHGRWLSSDSYITTAYGTIHYQKCSECGADLIEDDDYDYDFCPVCGTIMDGDKANNVRNLTDEETEIYESWIDHEAKDTGVNIMDGDEE